ncbi:MAG: EAL domain-containing protein [Planctomycetes bacterium]|nr:EAL domain-containing protein [Planctomycetota bacterium]
MVEPGCVEEVNAILLVTGVSGSLIEVEITENMIITDSEMIIDVMNPLRVSGIGLYMNDFGTGYSSLSCLHRIPFMC